jgi:hypothetical protein
MSWIRRILTTLRSDAHQREVDEELQFHVDMREQRNVNDGMSEGEAHRDARIRFGNPVVWRERVSEVDLMLFLKSTLDDLRFGVRQLVRSPAFALTAAITLALGIGANTAIFTLVNAVMLKNLPVADPTMLVRIGDHPDCCQYSGANEDGDYNLFSTDTYEQFKKNAPEFEELAAMQAGFESRSIIARQDGGQEAARPMVGEFASGNYFRMFGLQPSAGRLLSDADDVAGAPAVAVMSYETWKHEYNGAAAVIGGTFMVNTQAVAITGIAPEGFFGDRMSSTPPNFYFPIETMPALQGAKFVHDPDQKWLDIIGRVKPGVALASLEEKLSTQLGTVFAASPIFSSVHAKQLLNRASGLGIELVWIYFVSGLVARTAPADAGVAQVAGEGGAHYSPDQRRVWVRGSLPAVGAAGIGLKRCAATDGMGHCDGGRVPDRGRNSAAGHEHLAGHRRRMDERPW